jgi:hypothetical protein
MDYGYSEIYGLSKSDKSAFIFNAMDDVLINGTGSKKLIQGQSIGYLGGANEIDLEHFEE